MMIEKETVIECMDEFAVWFWQHDLSATVEDIEKFFEARGVTRIQMMTAARHYGVVITAASFEEVAHDEEKQDPAFVRFFKWIWR